MKYIFPLCIMAGLLLSACGANNSKQQSEKPQPNISKELAQSVASELKKQHGSENATRIEKGVSQAAELWTSADGSADEFKKFCTESYIGNATEREKLFNHLSAAFESLYGCFNKISVDLKQPIHHADIEPMAVDQILGSYDVSAHLNDDMFANKVAFITVLNFPSYTLEEKTAMADKWSRLDWGFARLGDIFTSRIPAEIQQRASEAITKADSYISDYNIMMGCLLSEDGKTLFPQGMALISHWNLRDELKSNYANKENGLEKQQMIYEVMQKIISQEIPEMVVNNDKVQWAPFSNKVYDQGKEVAATPEPDTRYSYLLSNFKAMKAVDPYTPMEPTYIKRAFDGSMEFLQEDVERIFIELISSPEVKKVGELIEKRLGRKLQPFDIWYDGFKSRSNISEEELDSKTRALYPNAMALEKALPGMLVKLGFSAADAERICSKIRVDAARGSGHAWGAAMKGDKARLRSRIKPDGLDYKGYNIGIHEFGHNVEQTISLYDVDYYMLNGVPNTSFTEALAFIFQKRDLELLGMSINDPNKEYLQTLDTFWGSFEIMGVALVDMKVWDWMYANPDATPAQLKENVIRIAKEVWNSYFAPVFGVQDSPILAIYSHMIDNPLYLSNYPMGHLIEFQLEQHLKGKNFADEIQRIYKLGRLIPQQWMKEAVGSEVSPKPMIRAVDEALKHIQ